MFDKLIEILIQFWDNLNPVNVINDYQKAVLLRFGKFKRIVEPGLCLTIPFVDSLMIHHTVVTTINLPSQSIITKDGKACVVKGVVKYKISDIKVFLLDVFDAVDAISDMTQSNIKRIIMENNWEECITNDLDHYITKKAKSEAKQWGIEIIQVTLTDIGQIRSIKLFNDTTTS